MSTEEIILPEPYMVEEFLLLVGFMSMIMTVVIGTVIRCILRLCRRGKSGYVFDEFYRYFPCSSEYAVNGYFKYLFKAWFTDSDCCVESVFLGIRRENYESGDNVN